MKRPYPCQIGIENHLKIHETCPKIGRVPKIDIDCFNTCPHYVETKDPKIREDTIKMIDSIFRKIGVETPSFFTPDKPGDEIERLLDEYLL